MLNVNILNVCAELKVVSLRNRHYSCKGECGWPQLRAVFSSRFSDLTCTPTDAKATVAQFIPPLTWCWRMQLTDSLHADYEKMSFHVCHGTTGKDRLSSLPATSKENWN